MRGSSECFTRLPVPLESGCSGCDALGLDTFERACLQRASSGSSHVAACDFRWINALQREDLYLCNKTQLYISEGLYSGFGRCLEAKNAPNTADDLALMRRASHAARSVLSKLYRRSMGTTTALEEVRGKGTDIEKYLYLKQLQRFDTVPYLGYACVACPAPRRLQQCLNPDLSFPQRPHHLHLQMRQPLCSLWVACPP